MSIGAHANEHEDLKDRRRRGKVQDVESTLGPITATGTLNASFEMTEIRALAERVFGDKDKAEAWLNRPNPSMSGQIPLDLLKDILGTAVVRETLEQIDNGIFA